MTERRDGSAQSYPMHQVHVRRICLTPGCERFIVQSRSDVYCLACQLDQDIPPPRTGRPPKRPWFEADDGALG